MQRHDICFDSGSDFYFYFIIVLILACKNKIFDRENFDNDLFARVIQSGFGNEKNLKMY